MEAYLVVSGLGGRYVYLGGYICGGGKAVGESIEGYANRRLDVWSVGYLLVLSGGGEGGEVGLCEGRGGRGGRGMRVWKGRGRGKGHQTSFIFSFF